METCKSFSFGVAILLFVVGAILTALGGGDGAWEAEGVKNVLWPPERVFDWISEPEKRKDWVEGLFDARVEPDGVLKKGARVVEIATVDGERRQRTLEITEFVPGSVFAYRTTEEGVELEVRYEVGPYQHSEQSRVDYAYKVQFPGLTGRVMEPLLGRTQRARIEAEFERLTGLAMPPE